MAAVKRVNFLANPLRSHSSITEMGISTGLIAENPPPIRILTFTTLYPNSAVPTHGVFVENRLRHLIASGLAEARVVAPVPWLPPGSVRLFPSYARFGDVPPTEQRHGVRIEHPRFLVLPKVGMSVAPLLLFARSISVMRRLALEMPFDIIDAHYFYPDGVAAALLGRSLNKPVVITARGSDINLIANFALPKRSIRWAANNVAGVITVSQALKEKIIALGVPGQKIQVLRNGVDLEVFTAGDRSKTRAQWRVAGPTLLSVGQLVELKCHDLVIEALVALPEFSLIIAGGGPDRAKLQNLAERLGVADRIRFLGQIPHEQLPSLYSAVDALVLASSREGWPNVLLEAMACGTPVIASNLGGIPEVVTCAEAGLLLRERTASGIAAAVNRLFRNLPDRAATRQYAESFSWSETTDGQLRLFRSVSNGPLSAISQDIVQ